MEDELHKIRNWANHGSLRQFRTEVAAKVSPLGYLVELEGGTLTIYKTHKEGGFLGIGARTVREVALEVVREESEAHIPMASADADLVHILAGVLSIH